MRCATLASQKVLPNVSAALGRHHCRRRPARPWAVRCSSDEAPSSNGDAGQQSSDAFYKGFAKQQQQKPKATAADALQNTLAGVRGVPPLAAASGGGRQ